MIYAMTNDLHTTPLLIADARDVDGLIDDLGIWNTEGILSTEETELVRATVELAQPPSEGLEGVAVGSCYVCGMNLTIQVDGR